MERGNWYRWAFGLALGTLGVGLLSACQGVLGIEERELAGKYPEGGYEGCRAPVCDRCLTEDHTCICHTGAPCSDNPEDCVPGNCVGCSTAVERCVCEGGDEAACSLSCADVASDPCAECLCSECTSQLDDCRDDGGCARILACVRERDCDPFTSGETSSCYAPSNCRGVIDDAGGPEGESLGLALAVVNCADARKCPCGGGGDCSPENECQCPDCWSRCYCEGKSDPACQTECGGADCQAPNCHLCADCYAECLCLESGDCSTYCSGDPCEAPACLGCADCRAQCACEGGTPAECDETCTSGECEAPTCTGCYDCWAQCACEGGSQDDCDMRCGTGDCTAPECTGCFDCYAECLCQGKTTWECDARCYGGDCTAPYCLGCGSCEAECECYGSDIATCIASCPVFCGTATCYSDWTLTDPLQACCPPNAPDTCGLDLALLTDDHACIPVDPYGYIDDTCERFSIGNRLPGSADLEGCCRPDGVCGFALDEGCIRPEGLGIMAPRTCVY